MTIAYEGNEVIALIMLNDLEIKNRYKFNKKTRNFSSAEVVASGLLKKTRKRYYVSVLGAEQLDRVLSFQKFMGSTNSSRDVFQLDSPEHVESILSGAGVTHGVFVNEELIAYHMTYFPGRRADNLGRDLGLPQKDLKKIAHFETVYVHPDYQGNGLQQKLHQLGKKACVKNGFSYPFATVSPINYWSLKNIFKFGLVAKLILKKYAGNPRLILFSDLNLKKKPRFSKIVRVVPDDLTRQKELFYQSYVAFGLFGTAKKYQILFGVP